MSSQNGYNTVSQNGFAPNEVDAEGASLLRKPSNNKNKNTGASIATRLHKHFTVDVSKSWADIALLGCYIITGLLDSSSVFIWGSFVSMQTGKNIPPPPPPPPLTSTPTNLLTTPFQATPSTSASESPPPTTTTAGNAPESPSPPSASAPSSSPFTTAPCPPANAGSSSPHTSSNSS
jgi:hypothetical protein